MKTLNGKALNSQMYLGLIKNLIGAINSGSVPNIENTWMSMCKVESYKAFEEAEAIYESYLKENLGNVDESLFSSTIDNASLVNSPSSSDKASSLEAIFNNL